MLRTIYSEDVDARFAQAVQNLERWVSQFYIHQNRTPFWGDKGVKGFKPNGAINEELGRRFRIEVVEEASRLNFPDLTAISTQDAQSLSTVFDEWVASVGEDPTGDARCARFHDFLAVDAASLASLLELPQVPPAPIRPFATREEKLQLCSEVSFVWFFDVKRTRGLSHEADALEASRQGSWMKVETSWIPGIWFHRLNRLERECVVMETTEKEAEDSIETSLTTGYWWSGV